ncbi:MAG: monovalent cation/H(+) antiporter subunit G [Desulfuromonadales bacterium]|jgi:multicomponent Na+:H+ antiporter subunit G
MTVLSILAIILILCGLFFFFAGTVGILRLPDFYTRLHAAGKCDSLAAILMICGVALYNLQPFTWGAVLVSIKLFFIALFVFIASPTATHAITEVALVLGVKPWKRPEKKRR